MEDTYKELYFSNGIAYVFESDPFEPKEIFNKRSWFIIKYIENHGLNLNNLNNDILADIQVKSRMRINEQYLGAKYVDNI